MQSAIVLDTCRAHRTNGAPGPRGTDRKDGVDGAHAGTAGPAAPPSPPGAIEARGKLVFFFFLRN